MTLITYLLFVCAGVIVFMLASGAVLFCSLFLRKADTSRTYEGGAPGVANPLFEHTSDPRIMDVITAAKKAWHEKMHEMVSVHSRGITLRGYVWEAYEKTDTVALLVHGIYDSAAGMAYLAEKYHEHGFSVLSLDCRGHGASGGKTITMGYTDAYDLLEWIDFLKRRFGQDTRIILHGVSMGAAAVYRYCGLTESASRRQSKNIRAVIADSGFTSLSAEINSLIIRIMGKNILQRLVRIVFVGGCSVICALVNGFFFSANAPVRSVARMGETGMEDVPLLVFHGSEDKLVPPKMAQELYDAAPVKKELVYVEAAPHIGSYFYDSTAYFEHILRLLEV